jgi:hypothetical protein
VSVYGVENALTVNPREAFGYVYLPSFAILLAVITAPVGLPYLALQELGITFPAGVVHGVRTTEYLVIALVFYTAHLTTAYVAASFFDRERYQLVSALLILFLPTLIYETLYLGPNMFTTALVFTGVALAHKERWFLAAVFIGFATFKFIGAPFAIVLFGYTVALRDRTAITHTILGGIVSQLPNIAYFMLQPDELLLILREHGAISTYSNTLSETPYHLVIQALGLEHWYYTIGFPLVVLLCSGLGILWAARVRGRIGLLGGFLIGYFATAYLIPAEQRTAPFVALTVVLILLASKDGVISRRSTTTLLVGLVMVEVYPPILATGDFIELIGMDSMVLRGIRDMFIPACGFGVLFRYLGWDGSVDVKPRSAVSNRN